MNTCNKCHTPKRMCLHLITNLHTEFKTLCLLTYVTTGDLYPYTQNVFI